MTLPAAILRIDTTRDSTITLAGALDAATAPHLHATLAQPLAAHPDRLILDLSGLEFCDSTGLAALVHTRNALPENGELILYGTPDLIRRLLRITHLEDTFTLA